MYVRVRISKKFARMVVAITHIKNLSKDDVPAVEPRGLHGGDEELASVGVLSSVGHGQPAGAEVTQLEVLVGELLAIDRLAASA